jgi:xylulokinase
MKLKRKHPEIYAQTTNITLVSNFLASLFLGEIAPLDISDVCGMNLWDIQKRRWHPDLLQLTAGGRQSDGAELRRKLGEVRMDGGGSMGSIASYFVQRYGFSEQCQIVPFTGDNPATILSLPLRAQDAIVSLGTSTTFLMSTRKYAPGPAVHFFNHPTTPGLYMFMLCYKNGGLAREKVRDAIANMPTDSDLTHRPEVAHPGSWELFEKIILNTPSLGRKNDEDDAKIGLFFPLPEIVPNVRAGVWRFNAKPQGEVKEAFVGWTLPTDDARAIVESQMLSLRLRSQELVDSPGDAIPPQPRRVYLVGGGSLSPAIARVAGDVLGGSEGVYKLDVGGNACALGGAYKAIWALEREEGETFEDLIGGRWRESEAIEKVDDGYKENIWAKYGDILPEFQAMEEKVKAAQHLGTS